MNDLALSLPNMLLESGSRLPVLLGKFFSRDSFWNLVITPLHRSHQSLELFLGQLPEEAAQEIRKESSVTPSGMAFL